MTLEELYAKKGDLITKMEIAGSQLKQVNEEIVRRLNETAKPGEELISVDPDSEEIEDA